MNVLSLFDGMSCGQQALERLGIKVDNYFASEINKQSIFITQKNYPGTIQLGDVEKLNGGGQLQSIDLLIGGSPCQDLRPNREGLRGEKSRLFYEYYRLLKEIKPKHFLLENVSKISKDDRQIITELLGVEPIEINSNLVSAQNRKRLYWTNIPGVSQPNDENIFVKDILQKDVADKYFLSEKMLSGFSKRLENNIAKGVGFGHSVIDESEVKKTNTIVSRYYKDGKECLIKTPKGVRKLTPIEVERLQTVADGYTEGVADVHRYMMLGNGWTVKVIMNILKNLKSI